MVVPAVASAGTYTWDLNSDFTATSPGANPDHDAYGGTPWSYEEGSGTKLPSFDTGINGGLVGWHDSGNLPLVAINNTGSPVADGGRTYPAGQVVLEPTSGLPAVVAWRSPLTGTVSVSGSVSPDKTAVLCPNSNWALNKNGSNIDGGSGASPSFSHSVSVNAGDRITLETSLPLVDLDLTCAASSVTFRITAASTVPAVTLTAPANQSLISAGQPRFTGTASAGYGVENRVTIKVYPGATASGSPLQTITATPSGTSFSAGPNSALPDGRYTAIAEQSDTLGETGHSQGSTFRIKVHPPALTVTTPAAGARTSDPRPTFAGAGGSALGDSSSVGVTLFSGGGTGGKNLGTAHATVASGRWSVRWGQSLKLGTYTLKARQSDDAGHTTTVTRSFVIVPAPNVIGSSVSISRSGVASVPISCTAPDGHVCTGDVLVLTVKNYRTVTGGPAGKIRVLFAYVSIPGGTTQVVKRKIQSDALHALRHLNGVQAKVTTTLKDSGGPIKTVSAQRSVRLASR
jgi:hypothetical protein